MNCDDALLLKKIAQEQRIVIARVMKALKLRGEDVCINPNRVRREDELAVCFTYWLAACPRHFSKIAVCGKETYFPLSRLRTQLDYRQLPSTAVYTMH